ncbi:MAG: MFS transporter [Chloroflexi bacterium]|nr:MFS transporter [Chloroflexota bacterium]
MTQPNLAQPPRTRRVNPWVVLAFVSIPVFVGSLDLTIVSAFLPEIIVNLGLPIETVLDDAAWVVSGYLLAYTVSMTFMGRVSDLTGRQLVYVICLILFIIGSVIVASVDPDARVGFTRLLYDLQFRIQGVRPDPGEVALTQIIIGRVIQALGGGAIVPVSLALVGDLFPAQRRAQPLGMVGAIDTLGWVLGHLYGGIMVAVFARYSAEITTFVRGLGLDWPPPDWRTLFWINIPLSVVALVGTWWALRNVKQQRQQGRFDFLGTALIVGAISAVVIGLGANIEIAAGTSSFEELGGLPPYAGPALLAGLIMFLAFIVVESRVRDPLYDLRLFRRRNLTAGLVTNFFVGFCLMIGLVSVPILINVRVADPSDLSGAALQVGILLSALTVPMALAAVPGGWLSQRIGYARTAFAGLALASVGFVLIWQTLTIDVSDALLAAEMVLIGIGLGLTFSPISAAVINAADPDKRGGASALVIIMRMFGMTLSVALMTAIASQRLAVLAAAELGTTVVDPFAAIDVYARLTAQVLAELGLLGAIVCLAGLIPAMLLQRPGGGREAPVTAADTAERRAYTSSGD